MMPAKASRKKAKNGRSKPARKAQPKAKAHKNGRSKPAARPVRQTTLAQPPVARVAVLPGARKRRHKPTPMEIAEHEHQDPRGGNRGIDPAGKKVQAFNYGQFKNKAVARLDKPVNWYRRAAKPKQ